MASAFSWSPTLFAAKVFRQSKILRYNLLAEDFARKPQPQERLLLTMAIFSRRDIQAAISGIAGSLTRQQCENLVRRLNGTTAESLAAEWEVVVISALCKCGRVFHEMDFGGETRPDIFFQRGEAGNFEFITDVRMVSDAHAHETNPYDDFREAIRVFMNERGHSSTVFFERNSGFQDGHILPR